MAESVKLTDLIEKLKLRNITESIDVSRISITTPEINRPGLQLAGYYNHFMTNRVQIIGNAEQDYLQNLSHDQRLACMEKFLSQESPKGVKIPCLILCRGHMPTKSMYDVALEYGVPILISEDSTSNVMVNTIVYLNAQLAPMCAIHAVLVDVYGEGVLITGESGIGKSEIALELVKRGHRLISDDVVEIRRISDEQLVGSAPEITKHFIELRGIGIINARMLFGAGSVKDTQVIDLKVNLSKWNKDTNFDRMGLQDQSEDILGNKIPLYNIPVSPGRNVAIIIECAAMNHRQKMMGYNAAEELNNRVMARMMASMGGNM